MLCLQSLIICKMMIVIVTSARNIVADNCTGALKKNNLLGNWHFPNLVKYFYRPGGVSHDDSVSLNTVFLSSVVEPLTVRHCPLLSSPTAHLLLSLSTTYWSLLVTLFHGSRNNKSSRLRNRNIITSYSLRGSQYLTKKYQIKTAVTVKVYCVVNYIHSSSWRSCRGARLHNYFVYVLVLRWEVRGWHYVVCGLVLSSQDHQTDRQSVKYFPFSFPPLTLLTTWLILLDKII